MIRLLLLLALIVLSVEANEIEQDFEELGLHYGKYLKEVVSALDKDQKFTETIKNMDANDIKTGKVAEQLKHVHEDVRKKLNDLKYLEIKRIRDLATRKHEMEQYGETYHGTDKRKWRTLGATAIGKNVPSHLGSTSNHFDMQDLHRLMVAATDDLQKIDEERKKDYKTYELEKEWQFQERLKMMNETEKQEAIKKRQQLKEKHDNHPKVHEPGTRQQFEEVWEKKDHLPKAEYDPKTFFALHDTNSDSYWDQSEVRQLLVTEIEKLYDPTNPEDDPNQMEEEYERMREHVYEQIDTDKDHLISLQEFLEYSKKRESKEDHGWDDLDKKEAYTEQDWKEYGRNRERMLRESHGHYDPTYYQNQPSNFHLPNWGLGMPSGVHPAQYYGYGVDPNHPQAQHIAAQQQQQLAYHQYQQQVAYQQPGAVPQQPYQHPQANQQYYQGQAVQGAHPAQQGQVGYQQPAAPVQQQAPPQPIQSNFQQAPPAQQQQPQQQQVPQQPAQMGYQPAAPAQQVPAQPIQSNYQQAPAVQQQQQPQVHQQQQQQQQAPPPVRTT